MIIQHWEPMINQYWLPMTIQCWEPMITQYWEYGNIQNIQKASKTQKCPCRKRLKGRIVFGVRFISKFKQTPNMYQT